MKRIFPTTLFLLTLLSGVTFAQFRGASQFKIGAAGWREDGDQVDGRLYLVEYDKPLTRKLGIAPSVQLAVQDHNFASFKRPDHVSANLNFYWAPIRTWKRSIKLGYGFSRRYDQNPSSGEIKVDLDEYKKGRNFMISYERRLGHDWAVGARGLLQRYKDDYEFSTLGVTLGFRL
ncbi:MAG TPA: hypothetical protein PLL64_01855 [Rhodothermales bacterium]|nr:hypothetical protein [Rhodothermales bacterium]HRR08973.1 hypothetical protein [Rhodothermales bacterium]